MRRSKRLQRAESVPEPPVKRARGRAAARKDVPAATGPGAASAVAGAGGEIGRLPRDVLGLAMQWLEAREVCSASAACRAWSVAGASDVVWRPQLARAELGAASAGGSAACGAGVPAREAFAERVLRWRTGDARAQLELAAHERPARCCWLDSERSVVLSGGRDSMVVTTAYAPAACAVEVVGRHQFDPAARASVNAVHAFGGGGGRGLLLAGGSKPRNVAALFRRDEGGFGLEEVAEYAAHDDSVFCCRGNSFAGLVATGGGQNDCTAAVFDTDTGALLAQHQCAGSVRGVCFTPGGTSLWAASLDKRLRLLDCRAPGVQAELVAHKAGLHAVQLVGNVVGTCCGRPENEASLWDVRALSRDRPLAVMRGHRSAVSCVRFDGFKVVTGSYDCSVRTWCALSGRELHGPYDADNQVQGVHFDGPLLCTADDGGVVTVTDYGSRPRRR